MQSQTFKNIKKIGLFLVIVALIFSLGTTFIEAWSCEEAFALCWIDYLYMPDIGFVYCGTGYLFCKKYIEK